MREERTHVDGIPTRVYDPGKSTALLLLGHGGGHGKDSERFVHLSRCYAEATGLVVVASTPWTTENASPQVPMRTYLGSGTRTPLSG